MKGHYIAIISALLISIITFVKSAARQPWVVDMPTDSNNIPECVIVVYPWQDSIPKILSDSVFNKIAGVTIYKVNRTELRPNDPFVHQLDSVILPLANNQKWELLALEVRGGASPEGPYYNNVRLANGRARRILDYINDNLIYSRRTDEITISTVPEDYAYLLWLLERDGDPAAEQLRDIIERRGIADHDGIKADMRKVDGGRYWTRLLKEYFPAVRAGRVVLYFRPAIHEMKKLEMPKLDIPKLDIATTETPIMPTLPVLPRFAERRHALAVSTNLLYDAFYLPNYGWAPMTNINVELFPKHGNFTYRFEMMFPYYHRWSKHKFFQIRDYHFEVRRYFNPGFYHTGWYLGAYVNNNIYGIGLSDTKGWEGEGLGAALKAGYVTRLGHSKRWRMEFHVAVGGYVTKYDPYIYGNPITGSIDGEYYYDWIGGSDSFHKRNYRRTWFGPTEAGITISYDVLFWRNKRKGVSFKSKEVVE